MSPLPFCHRLSLFALVVAMVPLAGCGGAAPREPDLVIGKRGLRPGDFIRPRAATIGFTPAGDAELYVVDFEGRIQVLDLDGKYLRGWRTPVIDNGRPAGLGWSRRTGNLLVADSHYQQLLVYSPQGELIKKIPGTLGEGNLGPFEYVADVEEDTAGHLYVTEFGNEAQARVRKLTAAGEHLKSWGTHGSKPGEFLRPRGLAISDAGEVYVADSSNHRIQVFDVEGKFLRQWGTAGTGPGQLQYPHDVALGPNETVYVAEFGNNRIQKFSTTGQSLGMWGTAGRAPGFFNQPWAVVVDKSGRLFALDSYNHRVQRVKW
jgi:DNA-binding beta-propeller fold protein YncE